MTEQTINSSLSSAGASAARPATGEAAPRTAGRKPHLTIRPSTGWASIGLPELWRFRGLLAALAGRDLKLRYKQTVLGIAWVLLQPMIAAGIFAFVFGRMARLSSDGVSSFLFAFAGLVAWGLFSNVLTRGSLSLIGNAQMISKVFFPRLALPLSTVLSALVDFGVSVLLLAMLMLAYRHAPPLRLLACPLWIALLLMLASGVGFIASALTVNYRDVQHVMPVVVQFLLYASPVGYSLSAVPERWRFWYQLNPLAIELTALRGTMLGTPMPGAGWMAYAAAASAATVVVGAMAFRRMERRFADVI
jgi:lipopolysaccharide transport system permease protein